MKTVIVVFDFHNPEARRYIFTYDPDEIDLSVGSLFESKSYDNPFMIEKILDEVFSFYNPRTGEWKKYRTSSFDKPIKKLRLALPFEDNVVYVTPGMSPPMSPLHSYARFTSEVLERELEKMEEDYAGYDVENDIYGSDIPGAHDDPFDPFR